MRKHKIGLALACVVFLMALRGGVAPGQERPATGETTYWTPISIPWEPWMGGEPPPGSSYLPGWYRPGDTIPCAGAPYAQSGYNTVSSEPLNSRLGVPEPGSLPLG